MFWGHQGGSEAPKSEISPRRNLHAQPRTWEKRVAVAHREIILDGQAHEKKEEIGLFSNQGHNE